MRVKPSSVTAGVGLAGPTLTATWSRAPGDEPIARAIVIFLEDRRVLFGDRHAEDEHHCIASVLEIRHFLTEQVTAARPGKELEQCLRNMRAACRQFVERAGPNGVNFQHQHYACGTDPFSMALGDLRTNVGHALASLLANFDDLLVEPELLRILPPVDADLHPDDMSWVPGMGP